MLNVFPCVKLSVHDYYKYSQFWEVSNIPSSQLNSIHIHTRAHTILQLVSYLKIVGEYILF